MFDGVQVGGTDDYAVGAESPGRCAEKRRSELGGRKEVKLVGG